MKKLRIRTGSSLTFEEGCNLYLDDCRRRNLREGTIGHYKQSYTQFYRYFEPTMPVTELTEKKFNQYVIYLCETLDNDVSINSYLRVISTRFDNDAPFPYEGRILEGV